MKLWNRHPSPAPTGQAPEAVRRLRRRTRAVEGRLRDVEAETTAHADDLRGLREFQAYAAERLADLTRVLDHVKAAPGSHVGALRMTGPDGRTTMGYVDPGAGDEEAAYVEFENLFRGSREEIQARQVPYLDLVRGHGPVLDLGCGRGEFLELLRDAGIPGRGVDLDPGMVAVAADLGLEARVGDLFHTLAGLGDGEVGAIVSFQVVEHLAPQDMRRLLRETHRVLAPDGVLVLETVNPHALRALRFFWLDLTHTVPVFPESLLGLARASGFTAAVAFFPASTGVLAEDLREGGDYALVASKQPAVLGSAGLLEL